MLVLKAKYSSRTIAIAALLTAAIIMLIVATGAIYTAIASPNDNWAIFRNVEQLPVVNDSEPEQFVFRDDVAPLAAAALNAAVPDTNDPIEPAASFSVQSSAIPDRSKMLAIDCLTAAIYYEAASEDITGQRAVAQVVLNRVTHPAYTNSVCGVVFQGSERVTGCQFSFTCDGSLSRRPSKAGWARAQAVAAMALAGYVEPSVGLATHYHTIWVVPYWSSSLTKLRTVGAHIFYRWAGRNGTRAAFTSRYSGIEHLPLAKQPAAASIIAVEENGIDMEDIRTQDMAPIVPEGASTKEAPRETGLLTVERTRIKSDEKNIKGETDQAKNEGLVADTNVSGIRSDNHTLMIDRK